MKSKFILCLALVLSGGLFSYSNIAHAQDKPDWSPIKTTVEVAGTIAVPPEYRQKLDLPERISFDIKMDSVAERIPNTERSKASTHYLVELKNSGTNLVYLDMTNTVSGEANGGPQQAIERITKSAIDPVAAALKQFIKPDDSKVSTTNTMAFTTNAITGKFSTLSINSNSIVVEKLKIENNKFGTNSFP